MIDWKQYEEEWTSKIRKHNYNIEYALNLMNQTWISLTELKIPMLEQVDNALFFTAIWHNLMTQIKNTDIFVRWSIEEKEQINAKKNH